MITNGDSVVFNPPVLLGTGFTHELLAFDGSHLFGIAQGGLRRYAVNAVKPARANIAAGQLIGGGFTLKTLTATAPNWVPAS